MSSDLKARFEQFLGRPKRIFPEDPILVACSGGLDSMVLAHLFWELNYPIGLAHVHFQLRDRDADLDASWVAQWAKSKGIPHYQTQFDTKEIARKRKKGIQETARDLRYAWLEQIRKEGGYRYFATAHHLDDQVETVLMNFFKGTGLKGMRGMQWRKGAHIRPLLFAQKQELQAYASDQGIGYRQDLSNAQDDYTRNALRLHVMPVIEQWFPKANQQMAATIRHLAEVEQIYDQALQGTKKRLIERRGKDLYLPVRAWKKQEPLATLVYETFREYGFRSAQTPQILQLMEGSSGQYLDSATHRVIRDRDFLIITDLRPAETGFHRIDSVPFRLNTGDMTIWGEELDKARLHESSPQLAYLNPEALEFPLVLRKWKLGDYFYPLGMGGKKKKLSRFFIEKKIPLHEKERIWVLTSQERVVWVLGMRLDERFKVVHDQAPAIRIQWQVN